MYERESGNIYGVENLNKRVQATLLNPDWCEPNISIRIWRNPDYVYRKYMYRKGFGASNLSGLDENPDYTCPDEAELPVLCMD